MGRALYRKHRPRKLSEVVGQDHITQTLENALKTGKISHAYLFTGPKGTGKTSIARILAHEINQLPYSDESIHLDIIEIDAASNRRIDEIRDLKDRIHIAPTSAKYKVYIIDEVHMLTREAFNALLKTLEEPPEHVVFILATTEAHKLPETIVSRTQRFGFRPIDNAAIIDHLRTLAKSESMSIEPDALKLIAAHGNGSFRDSIALLDQMRTASTNITRHDVQKALGLAPQEMIDAIQDAVNTADAASLSASLADAYEHAVQPAQLAIQLSNVLRHRLVAQPDQRTVQLLSDLLTVSAAHNPRMALDLALFGSIAKAGEVSAPSQATPDTKPKTSRATQPKPAKQEKNEKEHPQDQQPASGNVEPESQQQASKIETEPKPATQVAVDTNSTDPPTPGDWKDVLLAIKGRHNTLYGIVRMAQPEFSPGSIELQFQFPFHHKRVSEARYIAILNDVATEVVGYPVRVTTSVAKRSTINQPPEQPKAAPADLKTLTNVFGEGVAVEEP